MSEQAPPATPFKGLTSYAEEDAPFFFGREGVVNNVIASVQAWPHTLLYGASGVGKSSVLHAGVVYQFKEEARRRAAAGEQPEYCVVVFNSWSDDPVSNLLLAVRRAVEETFPGKALPPASASLSATLLAWSAELDCDLLVILDQFEEYFTYHAQEDGPGKLLHELPQAVKNAALRASFLISIREDALARLDRFQSRIPNLLNQSIRLRPLNHDEARRAIEKPIEKYNTLVPAGSRVVIEPYLVEAILSDAQLGSPHNEGLPRPLNPLAPKRQIEAPYLQQIMTRLWYEEARTGRLRLSTYERLGRAHEIVRTHLSNTIGALGKGEQEIAARIFRYLVTPSGSKIAQTAEDIADYARLELDDLSRVLDKLSGTDMRILRAVAPPPDQAGVTRYEIFHDVLAAPITTWWKDYEAEEQRRADIADAAHQKELTRVRALRWRFIGAAMLAGLLFGVAIYAQNKKLSAQDSAALARKAEIQALGALKAAEKANKAAIDSEKEAQAARARAEEEKDIAEKAKADAEEQRKVAVDSLDKAKKAKDEAEKQREVAVIARAEADRLKAEAYEQRDLAQSRFEEARRQRQAALIAKFEAEKARDELRVEQQRTESALALARERLEEAVRARREAERERDRADAEEQERARIDREGAAYAELTLRKHSGIVNTAAFGGGMQTVVTAGTDGRVLIWNTADPLFKSGRNLLDVSDPAGAAPTPAATPSPAPAPTPGPVPTTPATPAPTPARDPVIAAVSHDDEGSFVATATGNEALVWDSKTGELLHRLARHTGAVNSVAFSRGDRRFVVTGSDDHTAMVWDLSKCGKTAESCAPVHTISKHKGAVRGAEFHPKTPHLVATASEDGTARVTFWGGDADRPAGLKRDEVVFDDHEKAVNSASFNGDGQLVVTASDDGTAMVWRSENGNRIRTLREYSGVLLSRAKGILGFVRLRRIDKQLRPVRSAAFHPDTRKDVWYVATAGGDESVYIWDVKTGTIVRTMSGHLSGVRSVRFSPQGKYIITAGEDRTARIWNPCKETGRKVESAVGDARTRFEKYCVGAAAIKEALPQALSPARGRPEAAPTPTPTPDTFLNLR